MVVYRIEIADAHAHLFRVALRIAAPKAEERLSLPAWIPGSYLLREFARHLSAITARQGEACVALEQLDKATWIAHCSGNEALEVDYRVYAFDTSVRAAFLSAERGFFNGTSVFLKVHGREAEPHRVELRGVPAGWSIATALPPAQDRAPGRADFEAGSYDALVDHPVELGAFWRGSFEAHGVPHELVVSGALPDFDGERLLADMRRICETEIAFWHGDRKPPFDRYVFLLNTVDEGHGGLEHRASTALIAARRDLPQRGKAESSDGYVGVLGLIGHEYFHTWNVKRLKPAEHAAIDYSRENYTSLLWFFEGFTSYYDDLLLVRAGLIDAKRYLKLIEKTVNGVLNAPGRKAQSVAEASFDAWVKYYRSDENTPNATISYYAKGSLVALALDLTLRKGGAGSLDDVMRDLWETSGGGPVDEAAIRAALERVGKRAYAAEIDAWVHGTEDLPLAELLEAFGVAWSEQAAPLAQRLGVRTNENPLTGIKLSHVLRGGAAEHAGLAPGDELIAAAGWRLRRLDDLLRIAAEGSTVDLMVGRDQRVVELTLHVPADDAADAPRSVGLAPAEEPSSAALERRRAWLGG